MINNIVVLNWRFNEHFDVLSLGRESSVSEYSIIFGSSTPFAPSRAARANKPLKIIASFPTTGSIPPPSIFRFFLSFLLLPP